MGWERKDVAHTNDNPPSHYTKRLYYDTAVFNTTTLRRIVEDVGVDHVLMGTDHPFELGDPTPWRTVAELGLDEAATAAILGGTPPGCSGWAHRPTGEPDRAEGHPGARVESPSRCPLDGRITRSGAGPPGNF